MRSKRTGVNCGGGKGGVRIVSGYLDLKRLHENLMSAGKIREDSGQALSPMIMAL